MDEELQQLFQRWRAGDTAARDVVLARLYAELRQLAARQLAGSAPQTLQATALVNEALLKLLGGDQSWDNRAHFFGAAARAMRQVLVDAARARLADKRGSGALHLTLGSASAEPARDDIELLALDSLLRRLAQLDPLQAQIVELRYFVGLSLEDTARVLDVHASTVSREWTMARAWLKRELTR